MIELSFAWSEMQLPLLEVFFSHLAHCAGAYKQVRTGQRATDFILGLLLANGRKTCMASRHWRNLTGDESADYKLFSRSQWDVRDWYRVVLKATLELLPPDEPLVVAMDDTGLRKWGKTIPQARYIHDPLALKWLKQRFTWGIRVLHLAAILPFEYEAGRPYAVPIGFYPKPAAKKPRGKYLTEDQIAEYQAAKKATLLTVQARKELEWLRTEMDLLGYARKKILAVVDGSFMNGSVAKIPIRGVEMVGRVRSTIRIRDRAFGAVGRTFYGEVLPTPDEYRTLSEVRWQAGVFYHGGAPRAVRIKVIPEVYWKDGTAKRPMRLIIVAGTPYKPKNKRANRGRRRKSHYFREPGYLLTTDLVNDPRYLTQQYLNRWQIEDTHRAIKTGLGAAHPQNTSFESVERIPSAMVAAYSLLLLAVLKVYGPQWNDAVVAQTASSRRKMVRRKAEGKPTSRRFSKRDLTMLLRNEVERAGLFAAQSCPNEAPEDWVLSPRDTFLDR